MVWLATPGEGYNDPLASDSAPKSWGRDDAISELHRFLSTGRAGPPLRKLFPR